MPISIHRSHIFCTVLGILVGISGSAIIVKRPQLPRRSGDIEGRVSNGRIVQSTEEESRRIQAWRSAGRSPNPLQSETLATESNPKEVEDLGEQRLDSSHPELQRLRAAHAKSRLKELATQNEADYGGLLDGIRISAPDRERALSQISKIQAAALELSTALQQYRTEQVVFDMHMRQVLSESDYSRYRLREDARAGHSEATKIREFAGTKGLELPEADLNLAAKVIQGHAAYTMQKSLTPYLELPDVTVEAPMDAVQTMRAKATQHRQAANLVVEDLRREAVAPMTLDAVQQYFEEKATKLEGRANLLAKDINEQARVGHPIKPPP